MINRKNILTVAIILATVACRLKPELHTYSTKLFKIGIPHGWIVKDDAFKFMPISARLNDTSKSVVPNYNVTLIDPNQQSLKQVADQNSNNNCLKGVCVSSTIKQIKIKANDYYKSDQEIIADGNRIVVQQYYVMKSNTIYLLSFFCLKKDFKRYEKLFDEIIASFTITK